MQHVLCFGDSLTWGHCPATSGRLAFEDRWPNVLAAGLENAHVIAEGLRGRSTCRDNDAMPCDMNGARVLPMLLHSHAPLDLVVIMLGTNDIYQGYRPDQVAAGLRRLVEIVQTHRQSRHVAWAQPDVLLVAPPPLVAGADPVVSGPLIAASRRLARMTEMAAMDMGVDWVDMREVAQASELDSVHLDAQNTRAIGMALIAPVARLLAARAHP
ncbi:SGNH/GDSL hydrolase family protein [Primorskyibacter sp. S187A]|uniref:SGNH/GDSL hydrolase family protein n=1 Tax=Primorskyibacter sp. S187A TaxID=3415130 RepID=UPI003C799CC1